MQSSEYRVQSTHSGVDKLDVLSSHSLKLCYLLLIALWRGEGGEGRGGEGGEGRGGERGGGTYMTVHALIQHVHILHVQYLLIVWVLNLFRILGKKSTKLFLLQSFLERLELLVRERGRGRGWNAVRKVKWGRRREGGIDDHLTQKLSSSLPHYCYKRLLVLTRNVV